MFTRGSTECGRKQHVTMDALVLRAEHGKVLSAVRSDSLWLFLSVSVVLNSCLLT